MVDADTAALVAGVRRGLLVSDLWYTRVLDPKSLVVTGLTRNGVWLIEDGAVVRAVRDLRFTESYPRALGPGAVLGLGRAAGAPTGPGGRCLVGGAVAAAGVLALHRRGLRLTVRRSIVPNAEPVVSRAFPQARHTGHSLARTARRDRRNVCHLAASVDPAWSLVCA